MKAVRRKILIGLSLVAGTLTIFGYQNFTSKDELEECKTSKLCLSIYHAMLNSRDLVNNTEIEASEKAFLANRAIEHAANRLGYGLSPAGGDYAANATESNWKQKLALFAKEIADQLSLPNGNVLVESSGRLREKMSIERNLVKTLVTYDDKGNAMEPQKINVYEAYKPGFNIHDMADLVKINREFLLQIKNTELQIENRYNYLSNVKKYTRDQIYADSEYKNLQAHRVLYAQSRLGYNNIPATDERRWSMIRKIAGSQKKIDGQMMDVQINLPEVIGEFWSNHFNIEMDKAALYAGSKEGYDPAIRKKMYGTFKELLFAVETHPAMLVYLDNNINCVDASGIPSNQNLGREILELHTFGQAPGFSDSVYNQADVEFASRVLAGVNIKASGGNVVLDPSGKKYIYVENENPTVGAYFKKKCALTTIRPIGAEKLFAGISFDQGSAVESGNLRAGALADMVTFLANHPRTKLNICTKLSEVFGKNKVAKELRDICLDNWGQDGDLRSIYAAMISSPSFWSMRNEGNKIKNPLELVISTARINMQTLDDFEGDPKLAARAADVALEQIETMGLSYKHYQDPTGYKMDGADWLGSGYLFRVLPATMKISTVYEKHARSNREGQSFIAPAAMPSLNYEFSKLLKSTESEKRDDFFYSHFLERSRFPRRLSPSHRIFIYKTAGSSETVDKHGPERNPVEAPLQTALNMLTNTYWFMLK